MATIDRDGRTIAYEDVGSGTPVLLLHAFPLAARSFWPWLDAPPAGLRLIAPDHRGFGGSSPGEGPATMEQMAEDAVAVLDAASVDAAVVFGASMGGYVAMALTRLAAMRVRALFLCGTQHLADDDAGKARRQATAEQVRREGAQALVGSLVPRLLSEHAPAELRARVESMILAQSPHAIAAASLGMGQRSDSRDILARFAGQATVVVGEADVITPMAVAQSMASLIGGAQFNAVARAGHLAHLEQPQTVGALLSGLVARL